MRSPSSSEGKRQGLSGFAVLSPTYGLRGRLASPPFNLACARFVEPEVLIPYPKTKTRLAAGSCCIGWGTRIRTWVDGVRVRSPAARRSPNSNSKDSVLSERIKPGVSQPGRPHAC